MKNLLLLLVGFVALMQFSSCSVEKRVHRKGWHVEWKRNYKKDRGTQNDAALKNGRIVSGSQEERNGQIPSESRSKNVSSHTEENNIASNYNESHATEYTPMDGEPIAQPSRSNVDYDGGFDKETQKEVIVEPNEDEGFPRPGISAIITMFILFAFFITLVATGGFVIDFAIILLGILWAGIILFIVMRHFRGRSKKDNVPYVNGAYNVMIYLGLTVILTSYLIAVGALGNILGLIAVVFLLILMGLLIFLLRTLKKKDRTADTEKEREKEETSETIDPDAGLSPEEKAEKKRKTTRGLAIFCGILVAAILALVLIF